MEKMFFVYRLNGAAESFAVIGAYSKKDEADAFADRRRAAGDKSVSVIENTFDDAMEQQLQCRLGKLGETLDRYLGFTISAKSFADSIRDNASVIVDVLRSESKRGALRDVVYKSSAAGGGDQFKSYPAQIVDKPL